MSDSVDIATRLLRAATSDVGDVETLPSGRDVAIGRLADALSQRRAARRRRWMFGTTAAAAAVLVFVGGGLLAARRSPASPTSELARMRDGTGVTLVSSNGTAPDGRLVEGAELRVERGAEARLDFDSGTTVRVADEAHMRLVTQTKQKRFALDAGSFTAKVAKLGSDERFVIATPDTEIEVRGTEFVVRVVEPEAACGDARTRVDVSEGVVVVRHRGEEIPIRAGERWPSCTRSSASIAPPPIREAPAPAPTHRTASTRPTHESSSSLGEQNDLFQDAMADKRRGSVTSAVDKLDRILTRYPTGPLTETAAIEKMRLLGGAARERAARDYLTRFPNGSARAEAAAVAGLP